jgi:hypothetical protein
MQTDFLLCTSFNLPKHVIQKPDTNGFPVEDHAYSKNKCPVTRALKFFTVCFQIGFVS